VVAYLFFLDTAPLTALHFYLRENLRSTSKVRGAMSCGLRACGRANCELRLMHCELRPMTDGWRDKAAHPIRMRCLS